MGAVPEALMQMLRSESGVRSVVAAEGPEGVDVKVVYGVHHEHNVRVEVDRIGRVSNQAVLRIVAGDRSALNVYLSGHESLAEFELELAAIRALVSEFWIEGRRAPEENDPEELLRLGDHRLASAKAARIDSLRGVWRGHSLQKWVRQVFPTLPFFKDELQDAEDEKRWKTEKDDLRDRGDHARHTVRTLYDRGGEKTAN